MPDKLSFDRKERLAAAKKKLKQFQENLHVDEVIAQQPESSASELFSVQRPLSAATLSTCSRESLAESSKSMDHRFLSARENLNDHQKSFFIDAANARNFSHDDARSPFQRVLQKPLSEENLPQNTDQLMYRLEETNSGDSTPKRTSNDVIRTAENFAENFATSRFAQFSENCSDDANSKDISANRLITPTFYSAINSGSVDENLTAENVQLRQYCAHVTAQFNELNHNYSKLYAAYCCPPEFSGHKLASNSQADCSELSNDQNLRLEQQLQQNLQTMSVLIEEKNDLQSQLRQAMEIANSKNRENEDLQVRLKESKSFSNEAERQRDILASTKRAVEESFERQTEELVRVRQEWAQAVARASEDVQDKSEAQAKLKLRSKECDALQKTLRETERRLAANEIYLRQLTGNAELQPAQDFSPIDQLKLENDSLKSDLNEWRRACDRLKLEIAQSKESYEIYGRQINQKLMELTLVNEQLFKEKNDLEKSVKKLMNEKMQIASKNDDVILAEGISMEENSNGALQKLRGELMELKPEVDRMRQEKDVLLDHLNEKAATVSHLEDRLMEKDGRISELTEHLNAVTLADSNTKSLLEQLHNEKATSSRCIAQNLALKTQLVEIEEKFVSVTNDQMENASKLQTAEHAVHVIENQLIEKSNEIETLKQAHAEECSHLKNQVNSILRHEYDRSQLQDRLQHYETAYKAAKDESVRLKNQLETLLAENSYWHEKASCHLPQYNSPSSIGAELNENGRISEEPNQLSAVPIENRPISEEAGLDRPISNEEAGPVATRYSDWPTTSMLMRDNEESSRELAVLKNELQETNHLMRRISAENSELHRIMDQNSTDENQNTIGVELNRAVERLSLLAEENENLRLTVAELNSQVKQRPEIANDDESSVCSEHAEIGRDTVRNEAFGNLKKFMEQLQERLKRAVDQNADLSDKNEQLEHLIVKLQSETETIGEYVMLYRHQRQLIRDKLKEKEDHVALLSHENTSIQTKLSELQDLVVNLMKERGALISYPLADQGPTRRPPPRSPPSKLPHRPHNLSETLVNEVTGTSIRSFSKSPSLCSEANELESHDHNVDESVDNHVTIDQSNHSAASEEKRCKNQLHEKHQSGTADRILQILTELQKPDFCRNLRPYEHEIHCKHCTGHMITL